MKRVKVKREEPYRPWREYPGAERVRAALASAGYEATLDEAGELWALASEDVCAVWLSLDGCTDEGIVASVRPHFEEADKPRATAYREREYLDAGGLRDRDGVMRMKRDRLAVKMAAVLANRIKEGRPLEISFGGVRELDRDPDAPGVVQLECRAVVRETEPE